MTREEYERRLKELREANLMLAYRALQEWWEWWHGRR